MSRRSSPAPETRREDGDQPEEAFQHGTRFHTSPPHLASGATIAIEEAIVLSELIEAGVPFSEVLDKFMKRRYERCRMIEIVERALHPSASEWLFFRELRFGTGRQNGGAQRLDAFALNTLPHMAMKRVCYEVKTSRTDFLSELKRPLKRRIGMRYSNEFYFVTPAALVALAEIPPECGLIEAGCATFVEWKGLIGRHAGFFNHDPEARAYCMITVPAPWRDTPGPTWQLVAAMLRNQRRQLSEASPPRPVQELLQLL